MAGLQHPPIADRRPTLAVWKFSSCDGCQLTLLDCEDELLDLAGAIEIAYFLEASRATVEGPYDLSIVEGSISTPEDVERIRQVRDQSTTLVTIGACATAGGIQALRNFGDIEEYLGIVYAQPQFISTLDTVSPIAAHVAVDLELRGCPVTKVQLLEVINAFLHGRRPAVAHHSVCVECKAKGNVCVMVADGVPCLGPVTHAGCDALCPTYHRGCYGCFGPMESANTAAMAAELARLGLDPGTIQRMFHTFNAWAEPFRSAASPGGAAVADAVPVVLSPRRGRS
jgi:sulfhydrogenase subunit delta